jgi:phosphatidate cytidylyltransferase
LEESKTAALGTRLLVGSSLGGVFLLTLTWSPLVILMVSVASAIAVFELASAMRTSGWFVPRIPATIAAFGIPWATFFFSTQGQWLTVTIAVVFMVAWRLMFLLFTRTNQSLKQTLRDFGASAFVVIYVPLLLSFAALIVNKESGVIWIFGTVFTVALIDTFGYLFGRFFGKTKMSPGISPKKTWEGLAASILGAFVGGIITALLLGASVWFGFVFGAALLISSVTGDLSESLIKRDLNVKDMGNVLPGHGGMMDRIDSLLPSVFVAYLLTHIVF